MDDQSGRRPRRRLGERYGTMPSGRVPHQGCRAVRETKVKTPQVSRSDASQRGRKGRAGKSDGAMSWGGGCGRHDAAGCTATRRLQRQDSTPTDESSSQARPVIRSPGQDRSPHGCDFAPRDGAIAAAVKAVGDAIGEDEEFIRAKHSILSPNGKRSARTVGIWWHRGDHIASN